LKDEITSSLINLPEDRIAEVKDFVEFLLEKEGQQNKVKKLAGIWEGIGFEKIADLEKEIKEVRTGNKD
jgi:hypothetical protein